ncbi:MAG TPA: IS630 family transposase [Dermatophilaceae bacterium]|jgi:transposase
MWTAAAPLSVSPEQRQTLEAWLRAHNTPQSVALRASIVLQAAEGRANYAIAEELKTTRSTVLLWRERFAEAGLNGLRRVASGRGRKPSIPSDTIRQIVNLTLTTKPAGGTHWSCRSMAEAVGVSADTVNRVWRENGLKPHLVRTFKLSNDPRFVEKLTDVVGLYMNPPERALVLCVDEKSQIQALDRTQPGLPLKRGRATTMTHDYKRNGTAALFAALNLLDGTVLGQVHLRHRHQEFLSFLRRLDREYPADLDLHLVLDNYGTHGHPKVKAWLALRPRFHLHFVPTGSSWLNLIEIWFSQLTNRAIRRGSFAGVGELVIAIHAYIDAHNTDPKPFVWTASVESILEKVNRCRAISRTDH